MTDRFFIKQRVKLMINQYEVSALGEDGKSAGDPVCFVEQKRMKLKEDLRVFTDDSKEEELFRIKARQAWDPKARYDVTDGAGQLIGQLQKAFGRSLTRSTWLIFGTSGDQIGWAHERNPVLAAIRRLIFLAGFIPIVGPFLELIPIPYHFDYHVGERQIGGMERILGIRDRYRLDVSGDTEQVIDRRVALALAVGMDALQAR